MQQIHQPAGTLFERIGGAATIHSLVGALYFNILQDNRIALFFNDVELERMLEQQRQVLSTAFGDACGDRSLISAFKHLTEQKGLKEHHFDALIEVLVMTLRDLHISRPLIIEIALIFESARQGIFSTS